MVFKGLELTDHVIKEKYVFEETSNDNGGKRLVYKCYMEPTEKAISPVHVHTISDEKFEILEGEITIKINGKEKIFKKGDKINITRGTAHTGYNSGNKEAIVRCIVEPAYSMEDYIYTTVRLSNMGKTNKKDLPNPFMIAAMGYKYKEQAYMPYFIPLQKLYFSTIGFVVANIYKLLKIEF